MRGYTALEKEFDIPVLVGSIYAPGESQVTHDLNEEGIRIYDRLDEIAQILSRMYQYSSRKNSLLSPFLICSDEAPLTTI